MVNFPMEYACFIGRVTLFFDPVGEAQTSPLVVLNRTKWSGRFAYTKALRLPFLRFGFSELRFFRVVSGERADDVVLAQCRSSRGELKDIQIRNVIFHFARSSVLRKERIEENLKS